MQLVKNTLSERYSHSLIALAILLVITVLLVLILSMYEESETIATPEYDNVLITEQPITREITGTIVSIDASGEFMRVAIPEEGIYSIGINRSEDSSGETSLLKLEPMSQITITAEILGDTAMYDFIIDETTVQAVVDGESNTAEMTIEERVERLRNLTPVTR